MSKLITAGFAVGLVGLLSSQSFLLFLGFLLLMSFLGTVVAGNEILLTSYIVLVLLVNYGGMIVAWAAAEGILRRLLYTLVTPVVAFIVLAVPSSFVALHGCEAGKSYASLVMRATPVVLVGDMFSDGKTFQCSEFVSP